MDALPLYIIGAIAAASLFVVLLGPATGFWVALFYINAVVLLYCGSDDLSEKSQVQEDAGLLGEAGVGQDRN
jgi:hypothetical protein